MQTKTCRSLLVSGLLLMLCVSMLVGSTFAWFSDGIASKNNLIQSGNLDVALYYAATAEDVKADNWETVTDTTDIFGYNLWEPGYVKTAYFKVVNTGSLALKYHLSADVYAETAGVNKAGETFLLSDSIKTAVIEQDATREEILAMAGENLKQSIAISKDAQDLYPAAEADGLTKFSEKVFGLAIWMPTTVGNEANHNGTDVPSIDFGINLLATQKTYEMDSFGSDYDTGAQYPVEEEPNETLPRASVTEAPEFVNTGLDWGNYGAFSPSNPQQQLEAAYIFTDANGLDWVQNSAYKDWNCDYYVKMDRDVAEGDVFLGGNYGGYGWIGFENPVAVKANTEVPLLGSVVNNPWTYQSVVEFVETFTCGVAHLDESLNGATFTVILRLTNPADEADVINVATVEYTFDNTPA